MPFTPSTQRTRLRARSRSGRHAAEFGFAPAQTDGDTRETPVKGRIPNGAAVAALVAGLFAVAAPNAAASRGKAATAAHEIVAARLVFSESVLTDTLPATYELSLAKSNTGFRATFDWVVSSPRGPFTARTVGTWNPQTGRIATSEGVGDGYLSGAQLYAQGRISNPGGPTFRGSRRVVRNTAGTKAE